LPDGEDDIGNIDFDPLFVDPENGNFRLRPDSPCIRAGSMDYVVGVVDLDGNPRVINGMVSMGAYEYVPVAVTVTLDAQGGAVSPGQLPAVSSYPYGTLPEPMRAGHTFDGWFTSSSGGMLVTPATTVTNETGHALYAQWTFIPPEFGDYFVDASRPDDSGDGLSWPTAKKTIQAAVNLASAGSLIVVTNGVYEFITTSNKGVTIQSLHGAAHTFIDGGGTNRCATLGASAIQTATVLSGFTLTNGWTSGNGGGAIYGTLEYCVLAGNSATNGFGGGTLGSVLNHCTLSNNAALRGGGAYQGTLNHCALSNNTADYGGGASRATAFIFS